MSVYTEKLLELVAIEKKSDKYFLHIRLSFEQDTKMLWEIDEYTFENLKTIASFCSKYRYRLSLRSSWDTLQKQYKGLLTRTYRDQSDKVYFSCSEDYINKLTSIKHCRHIDDLNVLPFTSMDTTSINEQQVEQREELNEKIVLPQKISKFSWTAVTVMSILLTIIFSYFIYNSPNESTFKDKVLAQSITLDDEAKVAMGLEQKAVLYINDNRLVELDSPTQPKLPFVELNKDITYALSEGKVALTFDDGPSPYSTDIANVLNDYNIGGTFFFIGLNVEKYPEHVKYIHSKGYSIGSHTMNHVNLSTLSYERQKNELIQSSKLLEEITNDKVTLFRPPYGAFRENTKGLIHEHQYKLVLWNNDPKDWKTRDADKILYDIQNSDVSGSIIILHESQAVVDALPGIIEYLQDLDLEIVSLQ